MYPSIDIDFAAEKCVEIIIESSVQFENVNTMELGLYLSLTMSVEDLREQNILEYCARRKRMGKNLSITGCGVKEKKLRDGNVGTSPNEYLKE